MRTASEIRRAGRGRFTQRTLCSRAFLKKVGCENCHNAHTDDKLAFCGGECASAEQGARGENTHTAAHRRTWLSTATLTLTQDTVGRKVSINYLSSSGIKVGQSGITSSICPTLNWSVFRSKSKSKLIAFFHYLSKNDSVNFLNDSFDQLEYM